MQENEARVRFSPEQLAAIVTPVRETLVSAGAGSGKTSAVTQRVVNLVSGTDADAYRKTEQISVNLQNAADIRDMLIVTFTKAGASEMRTRIVAALEQAAGEQAEGSEEQRWLAAQADAALSAEIGTIHSMCGRILRDHYEVAGIAPDFEILDENAGKKLRKECAREAVNELLNAEPEQAHQLLMRFGPSARQLSAQIDGLIARAESQPDPGEWIRRHHPDDTEEETSEHLGELMLRARQLYREKKKALGVADYADLEHLTLETVRVLDAEGKHLGDQFQYIFVDEYQDVNPVQEELVQALGANSTVFMVGDLKQSIYGFRFAAPENFAQKNHDFCTDENDEQIAVHMNRNYRSTPAVVGFTNAVMRQLMSEDFGGAHYDEKQTLICSRKEADGKDLPDGHAEILVTEGKPKDEAHMIADKISDLKNAGTPLEDIVVLTRSFTSNSGKTIHYLREILHSRGVKTFTRPSVRATVETKIFLNLLRLLDNPNLDVPLLSVMRSVFFGFDERDFSRIASAPPRVKPYEEQKETDEKRPRYRDFHSAMYDFVKAGDEDRLPEEDKELYARVKAFEHTLQQFRTLLLTMPVREAAEEIARRLDFRTYLLVQPGGTERELAFEDLLDQLEAAEQLSGSSLHAMLDGFEQSETKRNPPMGAVPGVVRIMTIHASKGLEFPVVFLANAGNSPTAQNEDTIQSSDRYGITVKKYDADNLIVDGSGASGAVKQYRQRQESSQALRLLYVALTRARDKIYVCGVKDKSEKFLNKADAGTDNLGSSTESMLEWVMRAWGAVSKSEDPEDAVLRSAFSGELWSVPDENDESVSFPADDARKARGAAHAHMRLEQRERVASAVSVTEKHGTYDANKSKDQDKGRDNKKDKSSAVAAGGTKSVVKDGLWGADRGSLLHHVLEWVIARQVSLDEAIHQMQDSKLLGDRELLTLENDKARLKRFLSSDLGKRAAASKTRLTERSFLLEVDPEDGKDKYGRKTLLKGTIDLAFLEDDAWTIVDYKSDADADPVRLLERHGGQLQTYKQALEKLTGYPVKELYVFSLTSGETISMR